MRNNTHFSPYSSIGEHHAASTHRSTGREDMSPLYPTPISPEQYMHLRQNCRAIPAVAQGTLD